MTDLATYQPQQAVAAHTGQAPDAPSMIEAWAKAASDAARLVTPLVGTDFVPAHFRPKTDPRATAEEKALAHQSAVASATAAVLYGAELGLNPLSALQGIYITKGNVSMYARMMVALVMAQGHEVWTEDITDARAVVCGRRKGSQHTERVIFTLAQAQQAGYVARNAKYREDPQAMLHARAASIVCRRIAPDVLMGIPASVEELRDADDNAEAKPGKRTVKRATAKPPAPAPEPPPLPVEQAPPAPVAEPAQRVEPALPPLPGEEPITGEVLEPDSDGMWTEAQKGKIMASFADLGITERDDRLAYCSLVIGRSIGSANELTVGDASRVIESLIADLEAQDAARAEAQAGGEA